MYLALSYDQVVDGREAMTFYAGEGSFWKIRRAGAGL